MYLVRCDAPECGATFQPGPDFDLLMDLLPPQWIRTEQDHDHHFCSWGCVHAFCAPHVDVDDMDADALEALAADAITAANAIRNPGGAA